MVDRDKITYEQFIDAAKTLAVVVADDLWRRYHDEMAAVRLPVAESPWLDSQAARKHVRFGETKFRQLIREGILPAGTKIGGKLMWHRDELDRRMTRYFRKQLRVNRGH